MKIVEKIALNPSHFNQSAEKTMRVIELLAEHGQPLRLSDISRFLSLNASTALRFVTTLVSLGYIEQDPDTSRYFLTFKICSIANKVSTNNSLREIIHPFLKELAKKVGESACLAVEHEHQVVYIDVASGPDQMIQSMQRIGNIAPLHCTGIGKLLLLNYTESEINQLILQKGLTRFTEFTITSKEELLKELHLTKMRNFAFDNEECEIGARCVAFPIYDYTHKIVAGFSITGPSNRIHDNFIKQHLSTFLQLSVQLSARLGAEPS